MLKYTLQRILYMFIVFMIITLMCFVLIRMLPLGPLCPQATPIRPLWKPVGRQWAITNHIWNSLVCS